MGAQIQLNMENINSFPPLFFTDLNSDGHNPKRKARRSKIELLAMFNLNKPENIFQNYDLAKKLHKNFFCKKYMGTTIRSTRTGNRTENRTLDNRENFMC